LQGPHPKCLATPLGAIVNVRLQKRYPPSAGDHLRRPIRIPINSASEHFPPTGGHVYASADAGDTGTSIVRDLPAVLSVEVQTIS
jgi:hypothetical protein